MQLGASGGFAPRGRFGISTTSYRSTSGGLPLEGDLVNLPRRTGVLAEVLPLEGVQRFLHHCTGVLAEVLPLEGGFKVVPRYTGVLAEVLPLEGD